MNLVKTIFSLILLFTQLSYINAQNFEWSVSEGTINNDWVNYIASDSNGNVYVTGLLNPNIFIQKRDPLGSTLWTKTIVGSAGTGNSVGMTIDEMKNVYITGNFVNTVDFDPGVGVYNLTSTGASDAFILKLDSNGTFVWAKSIDGIDDAQGYSIVSDLIGNIYVTGYFKGTADFDPSPVVGNMVSNGDKDIFILKLNYNGDFSWVRSVGGSSADISKSIVTDFKGGVYISGYFQGTVDFDPGVNVLTKSSNGGKDCIVLKLDSVGDFVWANAYGGTSNEEGESIKSDGYGNLYVTGWYQGTVDFDPGLSVVSLTSSGSNDLFIQKFNEIGTLKWAKSIGGLGSEYAFTIDNDVFGNVYLTGNYSNTVDFDPGVGVYNLTSNGNTDIFLLKLDSNSNFITAFSFGDLNYDYGVLHIDYFNNILLSGQFNGTVDFNPFSGVSNHSSMGASDFFILKLSQNLSVEITEQISNNFDIYPNPTKGMLRINNHLKFRSIEILDLSGRVIKKLDKTQNFINISEFPQGLYFLKVQNDKNTTITKILKQ